MNAEIWVPLLVTIVVNATTFIVALLTRKTNADHIRNLTFEIEQWKQKYNEIKNDWGTALDEINELKQKLAAAEEARAAWVVERFRYLERLARMENVSPK